MTTTLHIHVSERWSAGDIGGCLMTEDGEVLWSHLPSSESWLRRDLTDGFGHRKTELQERFPAGWQAVYHEPGETPHWLIDANNKWYADRTCPECTQGKHGNCDGTAWDPKTDQSTKCRCTSDEHRDGEAAS